MKCTLRTDYFAVYDDVLDETQFHELCGFVADQQFIPVHRNEWAKIWSLAEEAPLITRTFYSSEADSCLQAEDTVASGPFEDPFFVYPTGDAIDDLFHILHTLQPDIADLVGDKGRDWARFSAAAFIYPLNAGLSWHTDEERYTGAYTYYLPERWDREWGGELLIGEPSSVGGGSEAIQDRSAGYYIAPRPNRLVVLRAGTPHKVNRVAPAAGDRMRYSISGFFNRVVPVDKQGVREISASTPLEKLATSYVARMHQGQASLVARNRGSAIADAEHYEVFAFIAARETPFCASDLPGTFQNGTKLEIAVKLVDADVLRVGVT